MIRSWELSAVAWFSHGLTRYCAIPAGFCSIVRHRHQICRTKFGGRCESDGDSVVTDLHVWQVGIGKFAAMVSIVAHEPKSCDSYRALLRGYHELVHVTIETHHCPEDHASVASA